MTDRDKKEIADIVRGVMNERETHCALGIKPETAHELIRFADDYKQARRKFTGALITIAAGAFLYALWEGIRLFINSK